MKLQGKGVSTGIGIGKAVVIKEVVFDTKKRVGNYREEIKRLENAVNTLILALEEKIENSEKEQREILESHIMLLKDQFFIGDIKKVLNNENCNCEYAVDTVISKYVDLFKASKDDMLNLRAVDLKDIKTNMLSILLGVENTAIGEFPKGSVLVANELTISIATQLAPGSIAAIVTKEGSENSHVAIIARSLTVPAVVGIEIDNIEDGADMLVNGKTGDVIINPTDVKREDFKKLQEKQNEEKQRLESYRGIKSLTKDGKEILICANIGLTKEIENSRRADAQGIGLFRTEMLFMNRQTPPSAEEQFGVYKKAAESYGNRPVIIRTLDVGGDKQIPYLGLEKEQNPFLGWRGIRYCLDRKQLFSQQILAILRASAFGNVKIMLPMISTIDELIESKKLIKEIMMDKLKEENISYNSNIEIGIMIETPSAALTADILAKEADFFSIGTNDLTQYIMAVDRGNKRVSNLYSAYQPAVLRSIYSVVKAAEDNGILCAVCGEAGADSLLAKFFVACGIGELSMNPSSILRIREAISQIDTVTAKAKIDDALFSLKDECDTKEFLNSL